MPDNFLNDYPTRAEQVADKAEKLRITAQAKKLVERETKSEENKRKLNAYRKYLQTHQVSTTIADIKNLQNQSTKRQGVIRYVMGKAERMEQRFASADEVPFLRNLESARAEVLTVSNKWLENQEKSVTDSFPQ